MRRISLLTFSALLTVAAVAPIASAQNVEERLEGTPTDIEALDDRVPAESTSPDDVNSSGQSDSLSDEAQTDRPTNQDNGDLPDIEATDQYSPTDENNPSENYDSTNDYDSNDYDSRNDGVTQDGYRDGMTDQSSSNTLPPIEVFTQDSAHPEYHSFEPMTQDDWTYGSTQDDDRSDYDSSRSY